MEPTLKGLLRFAERTQIGQPYSGGGKAGWRGSPFAVEETNTVEWFTPPEIFEAMETEFDLDVCSPGAEIVPWIPAKRHLTRSHNGPVADWRGCV